LQRAAPLSRQLATTTQFLDPSSTTFGLHRRQEHEDGRYILANRAFEKILAAVARKHRRKRPMKSSSRDRAGLRLRPPRCNRRTASSATKCWSSGMESARSQQPRDRRDDQDQPKF